MDLVGKTIRHGTQSILVLCIDRDMYRCQNVQTGEQFPANKKRYDELFMPPITKVKKKGSKGKHISGTQYLGDDD
jgi:hypothetical protein